VALPPLNTTLARRLMEQTRIFRALQGVRGQAPIDITGLENVLVRFSELIVEHPRIKEIDINPLLASSEGLLALDARIVLHSAEISEENLPGTAIRPYPRKYISRYQMKNGNEILIRPIRPEDEMSMVKFHETLSEQSVYLRYFHAEKLDVRAAHNRLIQKCFIDYDREMALVAERCDAKPGIIGLGRLNKERWGNRGEVAILIADEHQNMGLGTQLLGRLIDVARNEGLEELEANILSENLAMCALAKHFGFTLHNSEDPSVLTGTLRL
jgi:acetyltransferase